VGYKVQNAQAQLSTSSQAFRVSERKTSTYYSPASTIINVTGAFQILAGGTTLLNWEQNCWQN